MKRIATVVGLLTVCGGILSGQAGQAPKPGPEHQKLAAFVGNWAFTGEMKPGPMGPGGKLTGTDRIQWLPGNFFLERRFEMKGQMGEMRGLEILGFDAAKNAHTYSYFDSTGASGLGTMTMSGSTWSATGTASMGGKVMPERCNLSFAAGSASLNIRCDVSTDGGKTWMPMIEGTATKSKS
jgi:hypothetical protein